MATLLYPGTEFKITHQEMIKGIKKCQSGDFPPNFTFQYTIQQNKQV